VANHLDGTPGLHEVDAQAILPYFRQGFMSNFHRRVHPNPAREGRRSAAGGAKISRARITALSRVTTYDAADLELALFRQLPLATMDVTLAQAAPSEGVTLAIY